MLGLRTAITVSAKQTERTLLANC